LGYVLRVGGRFAESLAAFRRGHELGSKRPDWRYPSAEWVRQTEQLAALEARLPAFLQGEFRPQENGERLALVEVCRTRRLGHAAARLYAEAFAADPKLAEDLNAWNRYDAARHAALAAAGRGEDAAHLDDPERARLRKQALAWLRADLVLWTKQLESASAADGTRARQSLKRWQQDPALWDSAALAKLPPDEHAGWEKLWADVAALLQKAETSSAKEKKP
jgi:hypothetical protein